MPVTVHPAPANGTYEIWVPASDLKPSLGAPVVSASSRWPVMLFDPSTAELANIVMRLPEGWASFNVTLYWQVASTATGNVRWALNRLFKGPGEVTSSPTGTGPVVVASATGTADEIIGTPLETGVAITPNALVTLELARTGGDSTDTLAVDAAALGLLLTKAS